MPERAARRITGKQLGIGLIAAMWLGVLIIAGVLIARWLAAPQTLEDATQSDNPHIASFAMELNMQLTGARGDIWQEQWLRYRPNSELRIDGPTPIHVKINRHGFRGPDFKMPKPPGVFRIACLGGSTTVEGSTNDRTYPAILQRLLRQRFGDRIQVINCGVSGMDSEAELKRLKDVLDLEPDMLVHYNVVNDVWWPFARTYPPDEPISDKQIEFLLRRHTMVQRLIITDECRARGIRPVFAKFLVPEPESPERLEFYDWFLEAPMRILHLDFSEYRRFIEEYNRKLDAFGRKHNVDVLDIPDCFGNRPEYFLDVCHLNDEGIRHKAECFDTLLAPIVERMLNGQDTTQTHSEREPTKPSGLQDQPSSGSDA